MLTRYIPDDLNHRLEGTDFDMIYSPRFKGDDGKDNQYEMLTVLRLPNEVVTRLFKTDKSGNHSMFRLKNVVSTGDFWTLREYRSVTLTEGGNQASLRLQRSDAEQLTAHFEPNGGLKEGARGLISLHFPEYSVKVDKTTAFTSEPTIIAWWQMATEGDDRPPGPPPPYQELDSSKTTEQGKSDYSGKSRA